MKPILTLTFCLSLFSLSAQWMELNTGISNELRTVEVLDADHIFAAGPGILIKSINGGANWTVLPLLNTSNQPINDLEINDLHFFDAQTGMAAGAQSDSIQVLLRTTDGGVHWKTVFSANDPNGNPGGYAKLYFSNSSLGWAVGSSGIISKTTDGGLNWLSILVPNVINFYDVQFATTQIGTVCGTYNNGAGSPKILMRTTNGGQAWSQLFTSGSGSTYTALAMPSTQTVFVASEQGSIERYSGPGLTDFTDLSMVDMVPARRLHFLNNVSGYALTDFSVRRTNNAGLFWEQSVLPVSTGQELLDFDFLPGAETGFVVGKAGKVFRTLNGGGPWQPMAHFLLEPDMNGQLCADHPYHFNNPAPATYASEWFLDNQLLSTQNDIDFSFPEAGATYSVRLQLSGPTGSSEYSRTFETYAEPDFSLGELEWIDAPPFCAGNAGSFKLNNPDPHVPYTVYVNDVPFQMLYSNGAGSLEFTTPPLLENAVIKVSATLTNACTSVSKSDTLQAAVYTYPTNTVAETTTPVVCLYGSASFVVHHSETGSFYDLYGGVFNVAPVEGNDGDLIISTPPLGLSDDYQIRVTRGPCAWLLNPSIHIEVDGFSSLLDTVNNYGLVGLPIPIYNASPGLASAQWDFGLSATPSTSTDFEPNVTFSQSGLFPYTYTFHSQGSCEGITASHFEVFDQAPALTGLDCPANPIAGLSWNYLGQSPQVLATATDAAGNLLLTGASIAFVNGELIMNLFLQKNAPTGEIVWQKKVSHTDPGQGWKYRSTFGTDISIDPEDHIYLCGTYAADVARIFGQDFMTVDPGNHSQPQGFLTKLTPDGNLLWSIGFQSMDNFQHCAPSSVLYSAFDQRIYVILHGPSWRALLPNGQVVTGSAPNTAAWCLSFTGEGQFLTAKPIGDIPPVALLGVFYAPVNVFSNSISTYVSPGLQEGPNGSLYVSGEVYNLQTIHFGAQTASASYLLAGDQQRNHFVAVYDRNTDDWSHAFMAYGFNAFISVDDRSPAWRVDGSGNVWMGLNVIAPEKSYHTISSALCAIGTQKPDTVQNQSYLLQFSPEGAVNWVAKSRNVYFHDLADNGAGGMFALGGFIRVAGFHLPSGQFLGTAASGNKDVLLAEISASGAALGFRALGTENYDQPIALTRHAASGQVYTVFVPDLDQFFQYPAGKPYALQVYSPNGSCPMVSAPEADKIELALQIAPNPASPGMPWSLQCYLPKPGNVRIRLTDLLGRPVWFRDLGYMSAGANDWTIDPTANLQPGMYQLILETAAGRDAVRVVWMN